MKKSSNLKESQADIKEILKRIKNKDFSGNTGLAVKNSIYQFSTLLTAKIGSLIFTIILARLLLPELFGLYSLALSTLVLFTALSNLGIGDAAIRFISKELGKGNKKKAKSYTVYLIKLKFILIFVAILMLLLSSKWISASYYEKPVFLALIAGVFYIMFFRIFSFLNSLLQAANYFKGSLQKEIVLQILRLILVSSAVLFALEKGLSNEINLMLIFFFLALAYFVAAVFEFFILSKKTSLFNEKYIKLSKNQTKKLNLFLIAISATVLSEVVFGSIDIVMLGNFVEASFIGYYKAALSLVTALAPLIGFGIALLPIFSRLNKKRTEKAFNKSLRLNLALALISALFVFIFSSYIVAIIFGHEYLASVNILRLFSILLVSIPLIALYKAYFISIDKPKLIAKILVVSAVLNIVLNYFLISWLVSYGQMQGVFGAVFATLISRYFLLFGMIISRRKMLKNENQ